MTSIQMKKMKKEAQIGQQTQTRSRSCQLFRTSSQT